MFSHPEIRVGDFFGSAFDPREQLFSHPEIRVGVFFESAFDPAEQLFSHPEMRVGFFGDQHLICKAHHRVWSLKSTLGISLIPQGIACMHKPLNFHRL